MTTVALKRRAEIIAGQSPASTDVHDLTDGGLPFLQGNAEFGPSNPSPKHACDVAPKRACAGDVLLSVRAPVGALNIADQTYGIGRGLCAIRALDGVDGRFLWWALHASVDALCSVATGSTYTAVTADDVGSLQIPDRALARQRAIADYLDAETARIDALIAKKQHLIHLLEERIDASIMEVAGQSEIVTAGGEPTVEIRCVLKKLDRPPVSEEMITAFRDGQVTTRSARGKEGFTNSWTDNARVQGVQVGDVIVHGLDGFSGAIGDSEAAGVCSPVYHVCGPRDGGDPAFYGRLLRRLALTGYLGSFAVSTRERAVDFRNWDLFGRIPIPHVGVERQREIGERIRALRPLVALVERSEVLAIERKAALITRVVTGEFEVPGAP